MMDPHVILVAEGDAEGPGVFAPNDPFGELVGFLIYIVLPVVAAGLVSRGAINLWERLRVPRWGVGLAPGPTAAMMGILLWSLMVLGFFM
jgi:hypothetical protein